jgi:hypothetical protein
MYVLHFNHVSVLQQRPHCKKYHVKPNNEHEDCFALFGLSPNKDGGTFPPDCFCKAINGLDLLHYNWREEI